MGRAVVLGALLLLLANVSFSQTVKKYFKVGEKLGLSPQPIPAEITSIVWKYDKNLLAEWVKGAINLTYYSRFKGRTTLNTDTGVLEISELTAADSAAYTVEINNQVQSQAYQTVAIEDVPQPEVTVQPLVCDRPSLCGLKCHGDVTKAGPVTYSWKKDDGEWEAGQDRRNLSSVEMDSVKTFTCRMENPVSQKESKAFSNRFYQEKPPEPESSNSGATVGTVVGVLVAAALVGAGLGVCKHKKKFIFSPKTPDAEQPNSPNDKTPGENKKLMSEVSEVELGPKENPGGVHSDPKPEEPEEPEKPGLPNGEDAGDNS